MKAFTLIELLAVTTIILIFSGLSLAYYNNFNQEKALKSEAGKLVDIFELAKKKAKSGDLSGRACNGGFNGYEINLTNSGYDLYLRCGGVRVSSSLFSYTFPSGIVISTGSGSYFFRELTTYSTSGTIQIKNSAISKCLIITISPSGTISLSDNFISC